MRKSQSEHEFRPVTITIQLDADSNALLTFAAQRSGRNKRQEAFLRLDDHLRQVRDIATQGKRFKF